MSDATDVPVKAEVLRLVQVPDLLFEEMGDKLGMGPESEVGKWRVRALNPAHRLIGFAGSIGLVHHHDDNHDFKLWPFVFDRSHLDGYDMDEVIRIHVFPGETGLWVYGKGNEVRVGIQGTLTYSQGVNLLRPYAILASLILMRASMLAQNPAMPREQSYWDGHG